MSTETDLRTVLRPVTGTSGRYVAVLAALGLASLWVLFAWYVQLTNGLMRTTGVGDWGISGGVPWGLYIGTFIWWVGIAHGGILVSAAVRLLKLETYRPVARIAELLTLVGLSMAVLNILFSLGSPDRVFNTIVRWPFTVQHSPLIWDVTVITLYFVLTATYIGLSLRRDIYHVRERLPDVLDPVYDLTLVMYDPSEDEIVDRMLWWLALAIFVIAPLLLHGGVIPWLFAMLPSMPGWHGGVTGPQFLTAALSSAMGGVILIAFAFRAVYDWEDVIPDEVFFGLSRWMGFFALLFLWLQLQGVVTGSYLPTLDVGAFVAAKLSEVLYWFALALIAATLAYVALQAFGVIAFSLHGTVLAGVSVLVGVFVEKVLFVVEGQLYPSQPPITNLYPTGTYVPTWIEWTLVAGTIVFAAIAFALLAKVVPLVELEEVSR